MKLTKWFRKTWKTLFHRHKITPTDEHNDNDMLVELEIENVSSLLDIDRFFPRLEVVNGFNTIYIYLTEVVEEGDILVRFFEEVDGVLVWEHFEDVYNISYHGILICIPCPTYRSLTISEPVTTCIQVLRFSDGAISSPKPFIFLPVNSGIIIVDHTPQEGFADGSSLSIVLAFNVIINIDDIQVRFIEVINGKIVWKKFAEIDYITSNAPMICIKYPSYKSLDIDVPVKAYIQCRRRSDGAISKPVRFNYIPLQSKKPLPLMRLCRRVIRQNIGEDQVEEHINSLELPESLKLYLLQRI